MGSPPDRIMSLIPEQLTQFLPTFLEDAFHRSLRTPHFSGDFGDFVALHPQLDHELVLGWEAVQGLLDGQLQEDVSVVIGLEAVRIPIDAGAADRQAYVTLGGT